MQTINEKTKQAQTSRAKISQTISEKLNKQKNHSKRHFYDRKSTYKVFDQISDFFANFTNLFKNKLLLLALFELCSFIHKSTWDTWTESSIISFGAPHTSQKKSHYIESQFSRPRTTFTSRGDSEWQMHKQFPLLFFAIVAQRIFNQLYNAVH